MYQNSYQKISKYAEDFKAMYQRYRAELLHLHDRQIKLEAELKVDQERAQKREITDRDLLLAKADFEAANLRLQDEISAILEKYKTERDEIRAALTKTVEEKYTATPDKMDAETMRLLDSGILTVVELGKLADGANPTMRRIIAKYARDMADGAKDEQVRRQATALSAMITQNINGNAEAAAFDSLADVADRAMTLGRKELTGPRMVGDFGYAEGFASRFDTFFENSMAQLESLED